MSKAKHEYTAPEFLEDSEAILKELFRTATNNQKRAKIHALLETSKARKQAEADYLEQFGNDAWGEQ